MYHAILQYLSYPLSPPLLVSFVDILSCLISCASYRKNRWKGCIYFLLWRIRLLTFLRISKQEEDWSSLQILCLWTCHQQSQLVRWCHSGILMQSPFVWLNFWHENKIRMFPNMVILETVSSPLTIVRQFYIVPLICEKKMKMAYLPFSIFRKYFQVSFSFGQLLYLSLVHSCWDFLLGRSVTSWLYQ